MELHGMCILFVLMHSAVLAACLTLLVRWWEGAVGCLSRLLLSGRYCTE